MSELRSLVLGLAKLYVEDAARMVGVLRRHFSCQNLLQAQRAGSIPRQGELPDELHFEFHGVGCLLSTPSKKLDLDFGPDGRCDGFDAWRLYLFASENELGLEKPTLAEVEEGLVQLDRAGEVMKPKTDPSPHLFYFSTKEPGNTAWGGKRKGTGKRKGGKRKGTA
jgi:hypothetical protein